MPGCGIMPICSEPDDVEVEKRVVEAVVVFCASMEIPDLLDRPSGFAG